MNDWKEKLKIYYKTKYWQAGIDLVEEIIFNDKNNRDAYLNICHFIINFLAYEDFNYDYVDYYVHLFNKYFEMSYEKFKDDPIYLHFIASILGCADWILKNKNINYQELFDKAFEIEPENILFKAKNYSKKIFELCKCDFIDGKLVFEKPAERKLQIKEMESEIDSFCEIVAYEYDNIKNEYSKIGKVGELEVEFFESFCYKQLVKIGKVKPVVLPKLY